MREELLRFALLNGIKRITLNLNNGETWIFNLIKHSVEETEYQFYLKGTIPVHWKKY